MIAAGDDSTMLAAAMPFVHPWVAAAGAGLATVPLIIHLLNRRRFRRVVWAAMTFLLAANRRDARRLKIEQLLLLIVRTAIMILIGMALARPLLRASPLADAIGRASIHRVILLDTSQSMAMPSGEGRTAFEHARALALSLLDSFNPTDGVSLITLATSAEAVFERPVHDRALVREELERLTVTQKGTDLLGGFSRAAALLEQSEAPIGSRVVYVLSDQARSAWNPAGAVESDATGGAFAAAKRVMERATVKLITVGRAERANLAITDLAAQTRLIGTEDPAAFELRIDNYSRDPGRELTLEVRADGQLLRTLTPGTIAPGGAATVPFSVRFATPGSHRLEVVLRGGTDEGLALDNTRHLAVVARKAVPVLLVDGKPGLTRYDGQTGYLTTALAPKADPTDPVLFAPKTIHETELAGEPFDRYAVIVLSNVRRLDEATWQRLAAFVEGGGGLLVFLGDQVSTEHYNRLGFADGTGLLPGRLDRLVEARSDAEPHRFSPREYTHPILADFADAPRGGLLLTSIYRYVRVTVPPDRPGARTILPYASGDPAIIEQAFGEGRVALVTTTANMEWTNFPARGGYLPLMQNLVQYLAPVEGGHRNGRVGASLVEPMSARESSLTLSGVRPDGSPFLPKLRPAGAGFEAVLADTTLAGFYELHVGPGRILFATHVDPAESDLAEVSEDELREKLGADVEVVVRPDLFEDNAVVTAAQDIGPRLLYAVLMLVLVETGLAMWFGRAR